MLVKLLDFTNRRGKSFSARIMQWRRWLPKPVHPKHFIADDDWLGMIRNDDVVLDVGCGNGSLVNRLKKRITYIRGVDRNPPDGPEFVTWDLEQGIPFDNQFFNVVLCLDVIEHMHGRTALLKECLRVLKPRGLLVITGPNKSTKWRDQLRQAGLFSYSDPDHKIEYALYEFEREIESAGFTVTHMMPTVYDTPFAGLMDCVGALSLTVYRVWMRYKRWMAIRLPHEATGFIAFCEPAPIERIMKDALSHLQKTCEKQEQEK